MVTGDEWWSVFLFGALLAPTSCTDDNQDGISTRLAEQARSFLSTHDSFARGDVFIALANWLDYVAMWIVFLVL